MADPAEKISVRQLAAGGREKQGTIFCVASSRPPMQIVRTHENFSFARGRVDGIHGHGFF
jgi:hypothetical protein